MLKTGNNLTLATLAATLAATAQAQVIDDFNGPQNTNYVAFTSAAGGVNIPSSLVAAAVPGGYRSLTISGDPSAAGVAFAALQGGGGLWGFSNAPQRLDFTLNYGTVQAMNLDLSGSAALRLEMFVNTPMKLVVYATTETSPGANPDGSAFSIDMPFLLMQNVDIPLSAFAVNSSTGRPVNWADVDGLAFFFSGGFPADLSGDSFHALSLTALPVPVPEPASVVLLAGGLALLISRRKLRSTRGQTA
jgi:hypothetical protein